MNIPPEITAVMDEVFEYAPQIDSWIVLKRELLNNLPINLRRLFSTRNQQTKRTWTNEFELALAKRWTELTGRQIIFKDDEGKAPESKSSS